MSEKNKVNNSIRESEKRGIRPGFLGGADNGNGVGRLTDDVKMENTRAEQMAEKRRSAADNMRDWETTASKKAERPEDNLDGTREAENGADGGLYSGKGFAKGSKLKGKGNGKVKKMGPFAAILLAIFGFGGVMMGTQVLQPFSLYSNLMEQFNVMSYSQKGMSSPWMKWQLRSRTGGKVDSGVMDPVKGHVFKPDELKITPSQEAALKAQGIDYDADLGKLTLRVDSDDAGGGGRVVEVTAENFNEIYESDADFHRAYNDGSQKWRGQFANWFGSSTINFITNNRLTRNLFANFNQKVEEGKAQGKSSMDVFMEMIYEKAEANSGTSKVRTNQGEEDVDEDGNPVDGNSVPDEDGNPTPGAKKNADGSLELTETTESVRQGDFDSEAKTKTTLSGIAKKFQSGVNIGCQITQFLGTVSAVVAGIQLGRIISQAMSSFLEPVSRTMAGDEAGIHEVGENLNASARDLNYKLNGSVEASESSINKISEDVGEFKNASWETVESEGTAMQAETIASVYGERKVNYDDLGVRKFNLMGEFNTMFAAFTLSAGSFASCTIAKTVAATVNAGVNILSIISCIGGIAVPIVGAVGCGKLVTDLIIGAVKAIGLAIVITAVTSLITTIVTSSFSSVKALVGRDWGNGSIYKGTQNVYRMSAQRSGTPVASKEAYAAYIIERDKLIADDARYAREKLSPFDVTSKYTFMGSIMNSMMGFMTSSGTLMNTIKTGGTVVSNSVASLGGVASAYNAFSDLYTDEEYEKICPYAASVGAICTGVGDQINVTDVSTQNMHPADVINKINALDSDNFEDEETSDGNVIVGEGSELAKYIVYSTNRSTQVGMVDYNIANSIGSFGVVQSAGTVGNSIFNGAIGSTFIGDGIDIINNAKMLANLDTIDGEENVIGRGDWDTKTKYYSRFCEQQTYAESIGMVEKSACSAYLEDYLARNPVDDSYLGIISMYSGVPKEDVAMAIDILWYADYLANYHPEERYAFEGVKFESDEVEIPVFNEENVLSGEMTGAPEVIYADVRNRSFAV